MAAETRPSAVLEEARLVEPLREVTVVALDEWAVRRMWHGVQERVAARSARGLFRGGVGRRQGAAWLLSAALLASLGVGVVAGVPALRGQAAPQLEPGPLLTRQARPFEGLAAAEGEAPAQVEFADGSRIEAAPGARVEPLASNAHEFVVLVRRGRARFVVTPGGPRRWLIETRQARVEVVGTVLTVESDDTGANVAVEVGSVLVRSPALADGVQRVEAGQSLRLDAPRPSPGAQPSPEAQPSHEAQPSLEAQPRERTEPADRLHALPHAARLTPAHAGRAPLATARPRAAQLWESADKAREDGNPASAAALLESLLREHPDDSQVALAAFTLGVLQLDQLGQPGQAARSFERAIELGIGHALREDAYARWVRSLARAGDREGARAAFAEYTRLYPRGRHRASLEPQIVPLPSNAAQSRDRVQRPLPTRNGDP